MLNPDMELQRLRWHLSRKDIPEDFIDNLVDAASDDMNNAILDAVASFMTEAVEHAEELGAHEFANEIDAIEQGGIYQIVTISGRTDYSTPERQMRDSLLRGAKVSKDGSRYRVIPIGDKSNSGSSVTSIFQDQKIRQGMIASARESIQNELTTSRSNRTGAMTDGFRKMIQRHRTTTSNFNSGKSAKSSTATVFRTVTDKQDPTTNWVMPAKDMDMSEYLRDLNGTLATHIVDTVTMIIRQYEGLG